MPKHRDVPASATPHSAHNDSVFEEFLKYFHSTAHTLLYSSNRNKWGRLNDLIVYDLSPKYLFMLTISILLVICLPVNKLKLPLQPPDVPQIAFKLWQKWVFFRASNLRYSLFKKGSNFKGQHSLIEIGFVHSLTAPQHEQNCNPWPHIKWNCDARDSECIKST